MRIPFIVKYPGRTKTGLVRKELVSTIDILPTILDAVNTTAPEPLPGKSVLPLTAGRDVPWRQYMLGVHHTHQHFAWMPKRAVRDSRYQLIENLEPNRENPLLSVDNCVAWEASRDPSLEGTLVRKAYDTYAKPPRFELYDLEKDPYSMINLAEEPEYLSVLNRLLVELYRLRKETNDPFLDKDYLAQMTEKHDRVREEHLRTGRNLLVPDAE